MAPRRKVGSSNTKRSARNRKKNRPLFKAWLGGRAKVSPVLQLPRGSDKAKAFEKIVLLLSNQQEKSRSNGERAACHEIAKQRCLKYDISMEDALMEIERRKDQYRGGASSVLIRRTDGKMHRNVRTQTFLIDMCDGIENLYECRAYTELDKGRLRVTFYGIAENTLRAQIAFKFAYNSTMDASQLYRGVGPRNSYRLGVADTLRMRGMRRRIFIEAEIERAQQAARETFVHDDDGDDEDYDADFDFDNGESIENLGMEWTDDIGENLIKEQENEETNDLQAENIVQMRQTALKQDLAYEPGHEAEEGSEAKSSGKQEKEPQDNASQNAADDKKALIRHQAWIDRTLQLANYQGQREEVEETYEEEQDFRLHKQRKRVKIIRDQKAFNQGQEDGLDLIMDEKRIQQDLNSGPLEADEENDLETDEKQNDNE